MSNTGRDVAHTELKRILQCAPAVLSALPLALALCLLWLSPVAIAQTLSQTELQKLLVSDAGPDAEFGSAVALSGDRALIGARSSNVTGLRLSGAVYVYKRDGADLWTQVAELTASDASANGYFGYSVSLSGNRALVGARKTNGLGSAYVYERDSSGTWLQVAKLSATEENDWFGYSVALSGACQCPRQR